MTAGPAAAGTAYELVTYGPEHRDDYLRLLQEAWGPTALTPQEFDWWFDRNPAGSLRSVALDAGGGVVGVAGHTLLRVALGGEPQLATFSVHATTDPAARGRGIFAALERKHEAEAQERGAAVALAFASAPTAPLFLGPLGWSELGRLRIWGRPVGRWGPGGSPAAFGRPDDAALAWGNHVVRDGSHLQWRFGDSPRGYERLESDRGYAVVLPRKLHRGRAISIVADIVAPRAEIRGLLRRAARAARGRLVFGLPGPAQGTIYASAGFAPTPLTLHVVGKALAGRLDRNLAAWRFGLGDTDFF